MKRYIDVKKSTEKYCHACGKSYDKSTNQSIYDIDFVQKANENNTRSQTFRLCTKCADILSTKLQNACIKSMESDSQKPYDTNIIDDIDKLLEYNIFNDKTRRVLLNAKYEIQHNRALTSENNEKYEIIKEILLKTMIGKTLYWSCPGWKIEEHIITNVDYDVFESDFFDKNGITYSGTKRVIIELDNSGHTLADFIGTTLFFRKEDAINNSIYNNN